MAARIFTWDWKEQPDLERIAEAVAEVSEGKVIMREVETGSDMYAWVVSDHQVSDDEAWALYRS